MLNILLIVLPLIAIIIVAGVIYWIIKTLKSIGKGINSVISTFKMLNK